MVGALILGVVFGAAFGTIGQGFLVIENARDNTRASQILQSEMEYCRSLNYNDLGALLGRTTFEPQAEFTNEFADRYTCVLDVTQRKPSQYRIRCVVAWTDKKGIYHDREYITFYTEEGISDFYYRAF